LALAAPAIGAFQHAPHMVVPLTVMAAVLFVYSIYAPLVGALNGRRRFAQQATLDVVAAVLRTSGFAMGGYLLGRRGHGTLGAAIGAAVAALCMLPLALRFAAPFRVDSAAPALTVGVSAQPAALPSAGTYARSVVGIIAAQLCINLLMQSDLTMLGRQLSISAELLPTEGGARQADEWVGVYRACQLFAFLPYQLLVSVTSVLFPMLAKAAAEGDRARVTSLSRRGVRIGVLFAGLMVSVIVAFPESLIHLAYRAEVAKLGGPILPILAASQGVFAILGLATTILTSLGHEVRAGIINALALVIVALSVYVVGPRFAFGAAQLQFVALATGAAMTGALLVAWPLVHAKAGGFLSWFTALRVVALVCLIAAVARQLPMPVSRIATLGGLIIVATTYILALPILGLVSRQEIGGLRAFVASRFPQKA
jgi:stage V sporulation protein B